VIGIRGKQKQMFSGKQYKQMQQERVKELKSPFNSRCADIRRLGGSKENWKYLDGVKFKSPCIKRIAVQCQIFLFWITPD
jgi:hypothetical protein